MSMKENSANVEEGSSISDKLKEQQAENLKIIYQELCNSYRAIDDFRTKLLGFLPLATIAGIFVLVTDKAKMEFAQPYFWPIGVFGFVITLGLFFYELYGIKKCTHLIRAGIDLERVLNNETPSQQAARYREDKERQGGAASCSELPDPPEINGGQFSKRPYGVAGLINEPFASGVIYPAVLAAWTFLALASQSQDVAQRCAIGVFLIGFAFSFIYNLILILELDKCISKMLVYLKNHFSFARLAKQKKPMG